MRRWLIGLYPRAWRARYGDEFAELLARESLTAFVIIDTIRGAIDAHVSQRAWLHEAAMNVFVRWVITGAVGLLTLGVSLLIINVTTNRFVAFLATTFGWYTAFHAGLPSPVGWVWLVPAMTVFVVASSFALAGVVTRRVWCRLHQRVG